MTRSQKEAVLVSQIDAIDAKVSAVAGGATFEDMRDLCLLYSLALTTAVEIARGGDFA